MSETGEPRRRRRAAQDGGAAPAQQAKQPQQAPAADDIPPHMPARQDAAAEDGSHARRRRQSAQPPQNAQPHPGDEQAHPARYEGQNAQENAGAAQRRKAAQKRRVRGLSKEDAKAYAGKALRSARETALGVGALLSYVYEESCVPAARAAKKKLGEHAQKHQNRPDVTRRRRAYGSAGAMMHDGGEAEAPLSPAKARRQKMERDKRRREEIIRRALMVAMCCVACYSIFMIGSILWRTVRTNRLTEELSQLRREAQQTASPEPVAAVGETPGAAQQPEPTPEPSRTPQRTPTPTPRPLDTVKSTAYHKVGGDALPGMEELYNKNRDLIAWMTIEEVLDLPVVYRDNSYYLTHDFYKNKSTAGTLFLDVNHPFREKTQNLLLHGHNMKDGTMFGRLTQYEHGVSYVKNHPFIEFDTLWKSERYVIFAVLRVSLDVKSDAFFNYYSHPTFSSDASFRSYVRQLQLRSMYAIPVDVEPGDALLTLSTCLDDDRLVIVARRQRENESKSELRQLVNLATRQ